MKKIATLLNVLMTLGVFILSENSWAQAPTSSTPADNGTNVSVQPGSIQFNWSLPYQVSGVSANLDKVYLRRSGNATNITTFSYGDNLRTLTMTPFLGLSTADLASQLDPFTTYQLVPTGFDNINFDKIADIRNENTGEWGSWTPKSDGTLLTFSTGADNVNPSLIKRLPVAGATNVATTSDLLLTFDEVVVAGTGNIELRRFSDNAVIQTIAIGSATFSQNTSPLPRTTVTVPLNTLTNSTQYYVHIPAGVIKDDSNNNYAGITNKSYSFTTGIGDNVAPQVVDYLPVNGAQNVSVFQTFIAIGYDEIISVGTGQAELRDDANNLVASITPTIGSGKLRFSLTSVVPLDPGTTYSLYLPVGVGKDLADNPTPELPLNTYQFTTTIPPTVTNLTPANNTTGVSPSIDRLTVTFSEPIFFDPNGTGGNVRIYQGASLIKLYPVDGSSPDIVFDGLEMHINNLPALATNTTYEVRVTGALSTYVDADGNRIPNIDPGAWTFTTGAGGDITPPTVFSRNPSAGALDVPADELFTITFNEDIQAPTSANSGYIRIKRQSDDTQITAISYSTPSITNGFLSVTNNSISFKRDNLPVGTACYISIDDNVIKDIAGNAITNLDNTTSWAFTTSSANPPPGILTKTPATNTDNVPLNQTFTVTFDQNIVLEAGQIIVLLIDGETPYFYRENDANVSSVDNVLTFTLPLIENSKTYNIRLANIQNAAGNEIAVTPEGDWVFTTAAAGDVTPPSVVSITPVSGSIVPNNNPRFEIVFNENIEASDTDNEILVYRYDTETSWWDIGDPSSIVSIEGNTIITELSRGANPGVRYYIRFEANGIQDAAGNFMDPITDKDFYNFYGNRNPWGILLSSNSIVENNSIGDIIGTLETEDGDNQTHFYELVSGTGDTDNGSFVISKNELKANEVFDFEAQSTYSIRVSTFDGIASFEETFTIQIEDVDETPPQIVSFSPADDATGVALDADLTVTFNEPIVAGDAYVKVRKVSDNTQVLGGRPVFDTNQFTVSGSSLTIHLAEFNSNQPLANTEYYVEIQDGAVTDEAGNAFAGFTDNATWSFTTEAPTPPQIVSFNPADNATGVALDAELTVTFNEPIEAGGAFVRVKKVSDNTQVLGGRPVASPDLFTISGSSLTIHLAEFTNNQALPNTEYYVEITDGAVTDELGNAFADGFTDNATWSFTTGKADQTITIDPITDKLVTDASFDVVASTTSGLTLDYTIQSGPATISGNAISLTGATGTVEVEVSQAGDMDFNAATATASFVVTDPSKTDQTITFDALATKTFDDAAFDLTATASSGLSVSYSSSNESVATISGSTVTLVGVGTAMITATQAGDASFNPAADVQQELVVNKADQTITIDAIADKLVTDADFDVVAAASSNLTLTYDVLSGPATNSGSTITLDGTSGTVVVEVSQAGNSNYNAASAQVSFDVLTEPAKQDQTITFDALAAHSFGDAAFDLTASVSSGLTISYTSSDETVATINGTTVTIVGAGTTTIIATQAGDDDFMAASPVEQVLTVNKASQTITFGDVEDQFIEAGTVELLATASSGLAVSLSVVSGPATLNGTTLSLDAVGTVVLEASQAGDENHEAATVTHTFEVFTITGSELLEATPLEVYPSPALDYITLSGISGQVGDIYIYDAKGVLVKQQQLPANHTIDVSELKSGVYQLQLGQETIRFIKQ